MRKAWFSWSHDSGLSRDEVGGTFVYEDTGKTLAEEFPRYHFQAPLYLAWLFSLTEYLHGISCRLVEKYHTYRY